MHRIKDKKENENIDSVREAYEAYSAHKHNRRNIQIFEAELDNNLKKILDEIIAEDFIPGPYRQRVVYEKKRRVLGKVSVHDHVIESATIRPYEKALYDYATWQAPAIRPGMGNKALLHHIRNDFFRNPQQELYYNVTLDAHHYFPLMDHEILKNKLAKKIKNGKLLRFFYKVVDSYLQGAPLGIKIAQIEGIVYLADFDRQVIDFFGIYKDPEKMAYWTSRYITDKISTAKSPDDYLILSRGSAYLTRRFRNFAKAGIEHYARFVDNIIMEHEDKTFLHIATELAVMILARDNHIIVNKDWNVRPGYMGIHVLGYVFFHERMLVSKRNKQNLCRKIKKLQKKKLDEEEIRIACASQLGYVKHANSINLLKKIGMSNSLGKIIRKRKAKAPFLDMNVEQKKKFSEICKLQTRPVDERGWDYKIYLENYTITNSKIEKENLKINIPDTSGQMKEITKSVPSKVIAVRYKKILNTIIDHDATGREVERYVFEKVVDENGTPTSDDAEFYSFSGSKVLIDQAMNDFSVQDLPQPTFIQQIVSKNGTKFLKFT